MCLLLCEPLCPPPKTGPQNIGSFGQILNRWWLRSGKVRSQLSPTRVHVCAFARGDDEHTEAEVAIDMVANGLLPEGGYVEPSNFRGGYLDELGCNIQARVIRDAVPKKWGLFVSFSVTRFSLRRMQGDIGLDRYWRYNSIQVSFSLCQILFLDFLLA